MKRYSRHDPWRIGNLTIIIASMFLLLCLLSLVKPSYCPAARKVNLKTPATGIEASLKLAAAAESEEDEFLQPDDEEDTNAAAETRPNAFKKPICTVLSRSDTCDAEGDIRIQPTSATIFIYSSPSTQPQQIQEWKIRPYARREPAVHPFVRQWQLKQTPDRGSLPACTANHSDPAVVFSTGGFSGNLFHAFTDVLIPLFISARRFEGRVHLVTSDTKPWWVRKYRPILEQLSRHAAIDADRAAGALCFPRVIVGPEFHKELGIDPTRKEPNRCSMTEFRKMLAKALGLERETVKASGQAPGVRPRLLIISRKKSRALMNQPEIQAMAESLGYEAVVGEFDTWTEVAKFGLLVNSADVLLGVHGAGLTNMVFLPAGAVVIQIVPFGKLEFIARNSFREPAVGMGLKYLEYTVEPEESSLIDKYPKDHPVIREPKTVHSKGWDAVQEVYLDDQNVTPNLGRLKGTLTEALKLLSRDQ